MMSDLDLSSVLASAGPGNFDWLDVDEQQYRRMDMLPKQNLDIIPELKAQWAHADQTPLAYFVPNRDLAGYPVDPRVPEAPRTMGDLSQLHGPIHTNHPVLRFARIALVESSDVARWQEALSSKFSRTEIVDHRVPLASILDERGLLGGLYVSASDFPDCAESKGPEEFVRHYASDAKYVVSKSACGDCCHKQQSSSGPSRCGVFHKELVPAVPYSEQLAERVESEQHARGIQASCGSSDPRARIKAALTARRAVDSGFSGQGNTGALIPASRLTRKVVDAATEEQRLREAKARPMVSLLRRELLKGHGAREVLQGLRLAFDIRDLRETRDDWSPLFKEAGLYGSVYSTQDSFADCRDGADFLSKHSSKVRVIVAGDKCPSCIFSKVGRCLMYGRKLVANLEQVYTPETVTSVLDEYRIEGAIPPSQVHRKWGSTPREALQNIHRMAKTPLPTTESLVFERAFRGFEAKSPAAVSTEHEVIAAGKYMNEGLYGADLQTALQGRFGPRRLLASAAGLRPLIANNQGLQGIYFIDPTVYDDYGTGCKEAQRLHRSRQSIRYAKVGDKCASCVHQTQPGVCSVLAKSLVREPPYQDKLAQQRTILASGRSVANDYASLLNNGLTMMQEFELKGAGAIVELRPEESPFETSIQFGNNEVAL